MGQTQHRDVGLLIVEMLLQFFPLIERLAGWPAGWVYSGTSDNGHSEEWTTSLQWTNCSPPVYIIVHSCSTPTCPLFTDSTVYQHHVELTYILFKCCVAMTYTNQSSCYRCLTTSSFSCNIKYEKSSKRMKREPGNSCKPRFMFCTNSIQSSVCLRR